MNLRLPAAFVLCALGTWLSPARADHYRCPEQNVDVEASASHEAEAACAGATAAIVFLGTQGLDVSGPVSVHIVAALPALASSEAAGSYLRAERRVYVLRFAEFEKQESIAQLPVSRGIYHGVIAHEVAHAIAAQNFTPREPSLRAHEYVACVTKVAVMPAEDRKGMFDRFPGEGFDDEMQISLTIHLLNPAWFCAEAYRHYLKPGNGRAFMGHVLAGRALREED